MIIVLLLFFQSICLYCQRLVLYVYDRWINPENTRILKEAAELTGNPKLSQQPDHEQKKRKRKRYTATNTDSGTGTGAESCRFCANTPIGYCRHHFHLQELEIQKQQQRGWNPLAERDSEYRQWRKANRELKRNLKNRLLQQQQEQEKAQQQFRRQRDVTQALYGNDDETIRSGSSANNNVTNPTTTTTAATLETSPSKSFTSIYLDSGYCSIDVATATFSDELHSPNPSIETVYYFEPSQPASTSQLTNTLSSNIGS